jgi:hypothetical protein
MNVKNLQSIIKSEGCKPSDEVLIKVSIQRDDDTWETRVIPIESYFIQKDGSIRLSCCLWNEDN